MEFIKSLYNRVIKFAVNLYAHGIILAYAVAEPAVKKIIQGTVTSKECLRVLTGVVIWLAVCIVTANVFKSIFIALVFVLALVLPTAIAAFMSGVLLLVFELHFIIKCLNINQIVADFNNGVIA